MNNIHGINFNSICSHCGHYFNSCDSTKDCDVKQFSCNDFKLILIKINDQYNNFKLKLTIICNRCLKVQLFDFNIGKTQGQNLRTDESFNYICCNNSLNGHAFLSEDLLVSQEQLSNNQNNNINLNNINQNNIIQNNFNVINQNPIINNNNSINVINDNQDNILDYIEDDLDDNIVYNNENEFKREIERFEQKNIIEFDKKNILLNFLDGETKKKYKICSKLDLKLENVLDDLVSQFPELSYKNKRILVNNNNVNLSAKLSTFDLNADSDIIIK
jgi:hypothetical protein